MSQEPGEATSTDKWLETERSVSPAPSNVSVKSDWSKDDPPSFSQGQPGRLRPERSVSPTPDNVSVKSDWSKDDPPSFSKGQPGWLEPQRSVSPAPSNVSVKSDWSKDDPPSFSKGQPGWLGPERSVSPTPDNVSVKSDWSKDDPPSFSKGQPGRLEPQRSVSPTPDNVSVKSDWSKDDPHSFSKRQPGRLGPERSVSPTPDNVSVKSDWSKDDPPSFSKGQPGWLGPERSVSPTPDNVSVKSDWSKDDPPSFSKGQPGWLGPERSVSPTPDNVSVKSDWSKDDPPSFSKGQPGRLEPQRSVSPTPDNVSVKSDWSKDDPHSLSLGQPGPPVSSAPSNIPQDDVLNFLPEISEMETGPDGQNHSKGKDVKHKLTPDLKKRILSQHEDELRRHETNTEIYEIPSVPSKNAKPQTFDALFPNSKEKKVRTVLMRGVASVGKTFQKRLFLVDWAKGKSNKKIDLIVSFNFRELNSGRDEVQSMNDLIHHSFNDDKDSSYKYDECKVVFVLDGLEECELPLDFAKNKDLTDMEERASMDVLLTNLIKGKLLPSARLWIISRPSGVDKIPPEYIHKETECRGKDVKQKLTADLKKRILSQHEDELKNETDTEIYEIPSVPSENAKPQTFDALFPNSKEKKVRTVLMRGVAGVGKTFQKSLFLVDWAKGKSNKKIDLIVSFNFRELNSRRDEVQSVNDLIHHSFNDDKDSSYKYDECKVVFVLDGLEECKLPLDFVKNKDLTDMEERASMDVLLTNLIKGKLLPSACLWIISRPSGVDKIPPDYIHKETECRETSKRLQKLASALRERFLGEATQDEDINHPNQGNTEHIIREDRSGEVNDEEKNGRSAAKSVTRVNAISDIFKDTKRQKIRTVLTTGEAKIGKSFHVQQFIKEWAKKKSLSTRLKDGVMNMFSSKADVVIFPLNFSELNLIKEKKVSLMGLLNHFLEEPNTFVISNFEKFNVLFVLDGLDAYQPPLDFDNNDNTLTDVREPASVDVLLTSLIRGTLLPSARLWITSRLPELPDACVDRTTEIRWKDVKHKLRANLKKRILSQHEDKLKSHETDTEIYEIPSVPSENAKPQTFDALFPNSEEKKVRTVLMRGVAGVGKTFQKRLFLVDWAKGKSNTEIDLMVSFNFCELNSRRDKVQSMKDLLRHSLNDDKDSFYKYDECKVVFVLDGLEECELPLDFANNKDLTDMEERASMDVLLTNLIKGKLLPSARLWIISRPSGVKRIPPEYIHKETECRETSKRWQKLASALKERFLGEATQDEDKNHPNKKNTEHIMREDRSGEVNDEEKNGHTAVKSLTRVTAVSDIFKDTKGQKIRTVLTTGGAGSGKSFHVQQFIKEWAKKKSRLTRLKDGAMAMIFSKADEVIFPLNFSELNLIKEKVSLLGLLNHFFKETETFVISNFEQFNVSFVLDGLDAYQPPLDFDNNNTLTDVSVPASVDVLLTSLIRGTLLPSARLWITSRLKLPDARVDRTTEIRYVKQKLTADLKKRILSQHEDKLKSHETDTEIYEIPSVPSENATPQTFDALFPNSKEKKVRTVLMRGVAGVGKTFQKSLFLVDWAKGKSNKKIDLMVSFNFCELNSRRDEVQSVNDLIHHSFNDDKDSSYKYDECKVVFVLDGLEECELPLDFAKNEDLTDMEEPASMDVLLTNLIKGKLLPSASLWIISRPSGVDKIPPEYIHKETGCRETSKRWQKLASALRKRFLGEATQDEDINHPNKENTEHIIREEGSGEVNDEEKNGHTAVKSLTRVNAVSDIFKDTKGQKIRTVLTTGEAGIGKSFHVQQFIKEWAKNEKSLFTWLKDGAKAMIYGKADEVIFHLNFSKLNFIKEKKVSLMGLLNHFLEETKPFVISNFEQFNVLFVLDGLDDQPPLDFDNNNNTLTDVREPASVDVLLTSLIRGTLLPSARLWITSRKLSDARVDRTTEIRCKPDIASHQTLKSQLKEQFTHVHEGIDMQKASALLNEIYTDLYIIEGERGEVNDRHEIRQVQDAKFKPMGQETSIKYCDIFKPASENIPIRTVLTIGMAGIGKTFATKKYMLDWAEGSDNRDIYYMFPLSFRELNLRKEKEHSLEELIHQFCPGMKTSEITDYDKYRILIVLDGLDECRLDLDFNESDKWTEVRKRTSVNVLLRNLIQGNLLSKAQIWITSRPAASNHIPADKVDRVTEVRGFNDEQKEEYFRKRFGDTDLAEKILSHVKKSISLYIMCHIPVFCWITAKVLENFVNRKEKGRMPETLTDMYIHFLVLQCRQANVKYGADQTGENSETDSCWNTRNKETVMSLGKLAFEGLVEGNLLFTEETLTECGVDITKTAVFSGLFTQIKREGSGLYPHKLFCFVHLSIQEFLAAFYVFHTFNNTGTNLLAMPAPTVGELPAPTVGELPAPTVGELPAPTVEDLPADFYKTAIDKALKSKNGDWDLFLRFLLGLSLETNQEELQELLKKTEDNKETINKETIVYIKEKIREENSDADRNCNLFYCLNELKDHSLVEEVKDYLKSETLSFESFSTSMWSALTFVLLTSYEKLGVFDLKKYLKSEKVLLGMLPVVKVSKTALLSWCELSEDSCSGLSSSVLCSVSSNLTELDLSHNDLLDAGVQMLAEGLQSLHCKLEILKLSGCQVTEKGCSFLASALTSKTASSLKQLDLSYNHPGPEGETMLSAIAADPNTNLKTLCLDHCGAHRLKPGLKKYGADLRLDENTAGKRLALSDDNRKVKTVEKVEEKVLRPENIDRFKRSQVFCEEGLKGLCYWEVELKGTVGIAVAYGAVGRRWDGSGGLGCNKNSWSLLCSRTGYTAIHENTSQDIELDDGKTPEVKPNDGKTSEVKPKEGKTSEVKPNDGKTSEVKPKDGKTSEVKPKDGKTSEVKPNDGKTSEVKTKDGKTSEVKLNDGKTSEVKTNDGKTSEVKPNDGKTSEVKPKEGKTSEVKPKDGKTSEVKPNDGKTSEVKPKDGKTSEVKTKDGKTSEVKPNDGKTSEVKPNDGKTSEVKPNDGKTSEVKPKDGKTSEVKPNDGKTSEVKPKDGKTSEVKPKGRKTSEVKPNNGKTSEVKPKDGKTSEVKPKGRKTSQDLKLNDGKTLKDIKPNKRVPLCKKIAVFLDWEAGTLTYYGVISEKLIHIHTFHAKFTEPLFPCFWFRKGSVTLCEID